MQTVKRAALRCIILLIMLLTVLGASSAVAQPNARPAGPNDQYWRGLIGSNSLNTYVHATAVAPNGTIYIGGNFTGAGAGRQANRIARWDGQDWQPLGAGLSGEVLALLVLPNGDLLAGGSFGSAGNNPTANYLARWDGTHWWPYGVDAQGWGIDGVVRCLALAPNGDLIVGGGFLQAGRAPNTLWLARWNGTDWQSLGTGFTGNTGGYSGGTGYSGYGSFALTFAPNGDLLVGGLFYAAGGNPNANNLARWDGTTWHGMGVGLNDRVRSVAVLTGGDVVVGGDFYDEADNRHTPGINQLGRWSGSSWGPLAPGISFNGGTVRALTKARNGDLYLGGSFDNAGGNPTADLIARWDGTALRSLGTGLGRNFYGGGIVVALATAPNGDVIATGDFSHVGDGSLLTGRAATYRESLIPLATAHSRSLALGIYPNPATGYVSLPALLPGSRVQFVDALGGLVRTASVTALGQLSVQGLSPGLYTLRTTDGQGRILAGRVTVE